MHCQDCVTGSNQPVTASLDCACKLQQVEKKRKEKTTPFGVNLMRSQVLYQAAQSATGTDRSQRRIVRCKLQLLHDAQCRLAKAQDTSGKFIMVIRQGRRHFYKPMAIAGKQPSGV